MFLLALNPVANPAPFRQNTRMLLRCVPSFLILLAVMVARGQDTYRLYLSGVGKDDAVPWKFMCTSGAHSAVWTNLPVPSQWDMQGFGTLSYQRDTTEALDERGLYERDFTV